MNDINMYIYANRNFGPDQLAAGVLEYKKNLFVEILQTINLPFNENGSLKENTWDGWYQQEYAKIPQGK